MADKNENGGVFRYFILFLGLSLVSGLAFVFFRVIDVDEGFYLSAASLVANGASPYIDFFFPQMPILPVLLAPFSETGLGGLWAARGLALLCHLLLAIIAYFFLKRQLENFKLALAGMFMVAMSGPLMAFNVLAVQYIFSNLFFFIAFVLLFDSLGKPRVNYLMVFAIFFFLAAAVNVRLIAIAFVPLFFFITFFVFRTRPGYSLLNFLASVLTGLAAPSLYSIKLLVQSPDKFVFNNFAFHLLRGGSVGIGQILLNKLEVLTMVLIQPHYLFVIALAVWSQFLLYSFRRRRDYNSLQKIFFQLSFALGVGYFLIYMIFHPINTRFFQQPLIYFIMASLPAVIYLFERGRKTATILVAVYLLTFLPYPAEFIFDIRNEHKTYHFDHVRQVSDLIREYSQPADTLLAEWVGYNVFSRRPQVNSEDFTGFQYDFGNALIPHGKYRLMTEDHVNAILRERTARLVVVNNRVIPEWEEELNDNYNLKDSLGQTYIFERLSE
ncbi:MAG: hypothetical protein GF404_06770 [candidate division Zixibacteria bacterium]|nr:hypothetical protein [candidate division Zixibacteria bacterium]